MRIWAGFPCPVSALPRIPFNKPPLGLPAQLSLLQSRGLTIGDPAAADHYLKHIGYYRLSGYALPFQQGGAGADRHDFRAGTTFDDVLDRYVFDRKLRLLVMDAIERIEISVRAAMTNQIAPRHGAHWYRRPDLFSPGFDYSRFLDDIKQQIGHAAANAKRRDLYIEHYYQTYSTPDMPPSWMVFESVSFGTISYAYQNLAPVESGAICRGYGLPHPVLASWLHSLNYVRNVCAHHGRLWNRECRIKPLIARAYKAELTPNDRVYAQMVVMQILLALIAPGNHWAGKLRELLAEHPRVPATAMGFPAGWASRRIWGLTP
jgi:abortive infection bacteriophage resistance protein